MFKTSWIAPAALAALLSSGAAAEVPVAGDYVESRSANIYVGACHHEGEVVSGGRDAVLAWNFRSGERGGVSLAGVRAVAIVNSDRFLGAPGATYRSVLYIDAAAPEGAARAVEALLRQHASTALGSVLKVERRPISFASTAGRIKVEVKGAASLDVKKEAGKLCCKQPYEVWGQPLAPVKDRRIGYAVDTAFSEPALLQTWSATDMNNSFFGEFSL